MQNAVLEEVRRFFRPEFLNRVDEIIVFHALSEDHLMRIVDIQLERLRARLAERHIRIELTDEARRRLVRIGYDPAYGARPLKRAIQKHIENQVGRLLLEGTIRDGQQVRVDYDRGSDKFAFTPQAAPAEEPEVAAAR
jgi:ATP-dependent Clp protease ATP-binding subunit ClpB